MGIWVDTENWIPTALDIEYELPYNISLSNKVIRNLFIDSKVVNGEFTGIVKKKLITSRLTIYYFTGQITTDTNINFIYRSDNNRIEYALFYADTPVLQ